MSLQRHSFHDAEVKAKLEAFIDHLTQHRWIRPEYLESFREGSMDAQGLLFKPGTHQPLTAAFFGGTGVGKSTLINRLSGSKVARTGVERPTSREISMYLHESIEIHHLPKDLPLSEVRMARHQKDASRQILWIDMPDIDSVDAENRTLVLEWLPHIDVLLYVVSPERYRDDRGWELLKRHGGAHSWIFVMNQWDHGVEVQFEAFKDEIMGAGFKDPVIFKTDSNPLNPNPEDDLTRIEQLLSDLSSQHLFSQVQMNSKKVHLESMQQMLTKLHQPLALNLRYESLKSVFDSIWIDAERELLEGLEWTLRSVVSGFLMGHKPSSQKHIEGHEEKNFKEPPSRSGLAEFQGDPSTKSQLWDEWARGRMKDALSQFLVAAGNHGYPVWPLKERFDSMIDEIGHRVETRSQLRLRQALAVPGNAVQRSLMMLAGFLSVLLPVLSLGWASYQVVTGYYQSAAHHTEYLGTDFAIHTVLLVGLSFALPWFVYRRLKPSVEASARKGLREGIREGLAACPDILHQVLLDTESLHQKLFTELKSLEEEVDSGIQQLNVLECASIVKRLSTHRGIQ